jgi:epsilon-lactone hydrolase
MQPEPEPTGICVPERFIPTPQSVSPEAQAFLARGLDIRAPQIEVDDKEGWRRYVAAVESQLASVGAARASAHPARIGEHDLGGVTLYEVVPDTYSDTDSDKAIYHVHGGAFIVGGGRSAAYTAQPVASVARLRSYSIDYRMPPDHPFPAGLDDALEGYRFLIDRYDPARIAIEGSSAGANLVAAVILKARDAGLPLPGACVLHTAAMDLTHSGDTFKTNEIIDVVLRTSDNNAMRLYCGGHDPRDPYLSPIFADFSTGFPPSLLISGTRDMLLSPTVMMHRALKRAGLEAELHVFEAMPHGGFGNSAPEDQERLVESARFIREHIC